MSGRSSVDPSIPSAHQVSAELDIVEVGAASMREQFCKLCSTVQSV